MSETVLIISKRSRLDDTGIVYCRRVSDCNRLAQELQKRGIGCVTYHGRGGRTNANENEKLAHNLQSWLSGSCRVIVATVRQLDCILYSFDGIPDRSWARR